MYMMLGLASAFAVASTVVVDRREVTVGDLVRTADGRRFAGAGAMRTALRLPPGRPRVVLPAASVIALIRRQLPSLAIDTTGPTTVSLRPETRGARGCWASVRPMAAGEAVTLRDVAGVPCEAGQRPAVGQAAGDRAATMLRAQPAGAPLGRFLPAPVDRVGKGAASWLLDG